MLKRFWVFSIGFLSLILFSSVGAVADNPKVNWEGFYAGGYFANSKVDAKRTPNPGLGAAATQYIDAKSEDDISKNLGFFLGYNKLFQKTLIGVEVSSQNDVASVAATNVISGTAGNLRLFRLEEYKIRVGYPAEKFMPYLFLGRGEMQQDFTCCNNSGAYSSTFKSIGIGVERALGENVFAGAEYTKADWHYRLSGSTRQSNGDVKAIRLRLGYRFN